MEDVRFFSNSSRQVTKVFKALSDGTRQEILHLLEGHERSVGEQLPVSVGMARRVRIING